MSIILKFIDYNGIFKQKHDFTTYDLHNIMNDLVIMEPDYFATFDFVDELVDLNDTFHVLFNKNKMCARGFGLAINETQDTFEFILNFPATTSDINVMFDFIINFVPLLNKPKMYLDDELVEYEFIQEMRNDFITTNKEIILDLKDEKDIILPGKLFPFHLDEYFLQSIKDNPDNEFVNAVEEYMYNQQEIDAFFARPYLVLEDSSASEAVPVFSIQSGIPMLFFYDKNTYVAPYQENDVVFVKWLITVVDSQGQEVTVDFDQFLNNIPSEMIVHINKIVFYLNPLTDEDLDNIVSKLDKENLELRE